MYIINPLQARAAAGLMSTHPPTEKRVKILRGMGGAGLAEYEAAFRKIEGTKTHCIGTRTLSAADSVAVREASAIADTKQDAIARARQAGDLMAGLAGFLFITCACGVRFKVPPDFKHPSLACPRCGRKHKVPQIGPDEIVAATAVAGAIKSAAGAGKTGNSAQTMRDTCKGGGWESFRCACGHPIQISPGFRAFRNLRQMPPPHPDRAARAVVRFAPAVKLVRFR